MDRSWPTLVVDDGREIPSAPQRAPTTQTASRDGLIHSKCDLEQTRKARAGSSGFSGGRKISPC